MRHPPVFSALACALITSSVAFSQSQPTEVTAVKTAPEALQSSMRDSRDSLAALRKSARTTVEKVALTDAWLKTHPQALPTRMATPPSFSARMAALASRPSPTQPTSARGSLSWEVRQVWNETLSSARNPQEAVALTDAFLHLNAAALGELAPKVVTPEERRTRLLQINAERPAAPGYLRAEIAQVLRETRAEARTPQETVALTDEFVRLNAKAIAEVQSASRKPKSHTPQ